ncbi:MAG: efflux RND transporter permease subunit, partial [Aeoliella sp.]
MNIAPASVKNRTVTGFTTVMMLLAGGYSYLQLGQLEDPEFTVKTASIVTTYPGSTAQEVELEVTDAIEISLQELPYIDYLESVSRPGISMITCEILPSISSAKLPQIWDEVRKKVRDVSANLPPGVGKPSVGDDFGDVYGFLLAVTRDEGFTDAELERYVDGLKKELSRVEGVARVELWGVQQQCIYVDVQETQLSQLGLTIEQIQNTLVQQNLVVDSGGVDLPTDRFRIEQTGAFSSPEDIGELVVVSSGIDSAFAGTESDDEVIRIKNIGTIRRGYLEPPINEMRFNGQPALALSISNVLGVNIVDLGKAIDARIAEWMSEQPIGIEIHRVSWQGDQVSEAINAFMISLLQAVMIVLVVLWVAMGFRTAIVVGLGGLVFVILMSFLVMAVWGIDLQRMSLGALIVAMGMMVDNAIVVADGILVRIEQGMDRTKAAIEAATLPASPLLGATVVAVMAFYPIYASPESAGEYCESLFQVVAIALLLSWILSVTVTPLMCIWLLPEPKQSDAERDPYAGILYTMFRGMLQLAIRLRWLVVAGLVTLLVVALGAFGLIDRTFFPDSARLQVMIDYWAPQGTRIQATSADLRRIEERLLADDRVDSVSAFIGQGPPRFYLPVEPEKPYPSYAQLIVNLKDLKGLNQLIPEIDGWLQANVPEANTVVRRYGLGPSDTWTVEARISGPAVANPETLRRLSEEVTGAMKTSAYANIVRTDWRQREKKAVAVYNQERARWSSVSRSNIARASLRAYDGYPVGQFREEDKLLPIMLRSSQDDRERFADAIKSLQIHPTLSSSTVPLSQVTDGVRIEWED